MQSVLEIQQTDAVEVRDDRELLITEEQVSDLQRAQAPKGVYCAVKRILDVILSFCGLAVLLLPLALVALWVYIDDPGKVFFVHDRVGKGGRLFKLYKFRTMKMDTPKNMATMDVEDPDRYITRAGRILRKLSVDELPQLFNVLRGDMSLVGPRPLIPQEEDIHTMRHRFGVYAVRPGVTGLAQINGRDLVSPAEKVRYDVRYVEDFGFKLDAKILFATVPKLFGGEGVVEGYDSREAAEEEVAV
ncbi:MAG: sugar transferase [Oscillospiraceae bacterium]|nr:sugar transferase [Oscillospiraceae bacterium]